MRTGTAATLVPGVSQVRTPAGLEGTFVRLLPGNRAEIAMRVFQKILPGRRPEVEEKVRLYTEFLADLETVK